MKYKDGRKFKRKLGQSRKNNDIYSHLGHPYDIRGKTIIFIGIEEKSYCLTSGKGYKIIETPSVRKHCWDEDLRKIQRELDKKPSKKKYRGDKVECCQSEDYYVVIINDKGHKRRYPHIIFKLEEVKNVSAPATSN